MVQFESWPIFVWHFSCLWAVFLHLPALVFRATIAAPNLERLRLDQLLSSAASS